MFRGAFTRIARTPLAARSSAAISRIAIPSQLARAATVSAPSFKLQNVRLYSHAPELTREIIAERVIELLEGFDKIEDKSKITPEASFNKDLSLDSLDVVEVVMALEEEFSISVGDEESDSIKSVQQAIDFIAAQPDAV